MSQLDGERRRLIHARVIEMMGALVRAPLEDINGAIDRALAQMGQFCGVDRTYVFRRRVVNGVELIDNTHEYCAPGVPPTRQLSRDLPAAMIAPWRKQLDADACVDIADVGALPEDWTAKAHLQQQSIGSLLVVPMRVEGRFSGLVGFDAVRRQRAFPHDEVLLLKSVADAIGTVLTRADAAAEIAHSQASLAAANNRLMTTLRALPDLILELDADGRHTDVHVAHEGSMIIKPAALIGFTSEEVLPPEIAALNRRVMAEVDAEGYSGPHPFCAETARGRRHCVLTASRRPPLEQGEAPGYVFVIRDVTREWRLQRETERLSLIARRMTDLVLVVGLDNRVEWVNPAFEARTGWRLDEIRGRKPSEILHAPGIDRIEGARIGREMAKGRAVRAELLNQTRSGEEFWIDMDIQPLHDMNGVLTGFVSIGKDITEQVAAADALRAAAERAEAANQAKSRFLANMSHEIRTPLNGVLGMAQMLEDELSDPQHLHILGTIRESGEMLLGVLNDILDMSKIEAGKLTLEEVVFDPTGLAARIEAMHRPNATDKGLAFDLHFGPAAQGARLGDPNRLSQVLHNLIGNAVKFTEVGGVTVTMDTGLDGELDIVVRDTGIGMTGEQLGRVFEEFEQADGAVTRRFGGTGLGMSIVRRLVDLMGGEIAIDSTLGAGTEVRVRLPLPHALPEAEPEPAPAVHSLTGLRVLAADDNATNRMILKSMLARLGVEVVLAADGRAAVDAWRPGHFDVILLDISMPILDGISTLVELRAREAAAAVPPTPALAITANALSHQVAEYVEAGFAAHLGKPLRREDLAAALAEVSSKRG